MYLFVACAVYCSPIELPGCAKRVFTKTRGDIALSLASRAIISSLEILLLSLTISQYIAVKTLTAE
jgi:hypothetical protein